MKKILIICPYPYDSAAGQRLKYEQYFNDWRKNGYDITISPFMSKKLWKVVYKKGFLAIKFIETLKGYITRFKDIGRCKNYDLVYIFMYVTPFGNTMLEKMLLKRANKTIFDLEDNRFMGASKETTGLINSLRGLDKTKFLVEYASHVITSSPVLNEKCLALNKLKQCTYISSSVNTIRFVPKKDNASQEPIAIGWTGTFSTRPYLDLLKNVFYKLKEKVNFKLVVIGDFKYELEGIHVESIVWSKDTEIEDLQKIDIGLYPLPIDDEWVMGKSGLKAIQYMAIGIPCICTDISTVQNFMTHLNNGLLVKTDDEWVEAILYLINDQQTRKEIGMNARKTIEQHFSNEVISNQYLKILDKVLEN